MLNASTNFLDKHVAPKIMKLLPFYLLHIIKQSFPNASIAKPVLIVGMETAGGIIVSQLAAAGSESLNCCCDFAYMRKNQKTSGTKQQLEGLLKYTSRSPSDEPIDALWVDDALSSGESMLFGTHVLQNDYNIHVKAALYLVDRSEDRRSVIKEDQHQKLADPTFKDIAIFALYDLEDMEMHARNIGVQI